MKARPFSLTAVVALLLLSAPIALADPLPVKAIDFASEAVGRKLKYNIVLPKNYEHSQDRYPVLYLLHGYSSNYTAWAWLGVPGYSRPLDLIVVMPDAGNSWYVNWAESDQGQKNGWEDCIIKDLIPHVDANFRTLARREGRAINGLSMGGYGGLMLGLRHPDLFCSIGSHSGALAFARDYGERLKSGKESTRPRRELSARPDPMIGIPGFSSQVERTPRGKIFTTPEQCAAYDPFQLLLKVPRDQLPHIYLDCGTEDRLMQSTRDFARLAMDHRIPLVFGESAGGHVGPYWSREVAVSMAVQYVVLRRNLKAPASKQAAAR
jgi:putative tributyrin esterase